MEREALRYTPGGLPIVRFRIDHQSMLSEAGSEREVTCRVNAVAIGDIARQIPAGDGDAVVAVRGFLCRAGMNDDRLVLHVDAFKPVVAAGAGNADNSDNV